MINKNEAKIRITRIAADSSVPQKPIVRVLTPKLAASVCPLAVCSPIVPNRVWVMTISRYSAPNTAAATMTRNATNAARPA